MLYGTFHGFDSGFCPRLSFALHPLWYYQRQAFYSSVVSCEASIVFFFSFCCWCFWYQYRIAFLIAIWKLFLCYIFQAFHHSFLAFQENRRKASTGTTVKGKAARNPQRKQHDDRHRNEQYPTRRAPDVIVSRTSRKYRQTYCAKNK